MTEPISDHPYRPDRAGQWHTGRCDKCGEPKSAHVHSDPMTRPAHRDAVLRAVRGDV